MQPDKKLTSISVVVEFKRNAQAARFQQLEESGGEGGFEPLLEVLAPKRFSKLTPSRPVAWIQSVSVSISAVVRVKSAHLVIFMHPYMHLYYYGSVKSTDVS